MPKLLECEQADSPIVLYRGPYPRCVVAPGRQEQADVVQIAMGGDVLQGFESVLDEPQGRALPVCRCILGNQGAQVVTLMGARLLALDVGDVHAPMVQDLTGELPFFGGDEYGALRLGQQAAHVVERAIWGVARQPVIRTGSDPGA